MASMTPAAPTIAFFGSTGGCANACLVYTLQAGHFVSALARTPSKLREQLLQQGFSEETLSRQLTVVKGNALDVDAVKRTLTAGHHQGMVSKIVSGIGGAPVLMFNFWRPFQIFTLDNPNICQCATETVLEALQQLYRERPALASQKPLMTFISTTGVTTGPADVPFWMRFFYHEMLAIPHADKRKAEELLRRNVTESDTSKRLLRTIVGIRPTLLVGGSSINEGAGLDKVRVGKEQQPALGYTIRRVDVGHWMYENVVKEGARAWEGEMVTLTS